jgi:HK97 family phage major capsid protein
MKVIERARLKAWAKKSGWKGADLPSLESFIADKYGQIAIDGEVVDLEKSWANVKTVEITFDSSVDDVRATDMAASTESEDEDMDEKMGDEDEEDVEKSARPAPRRRKTRLQMEQSRRGSGPSVGDMSAKAYREMSRKSAYNRAAQTGTKINGKRPIFADADRAEVFGAAWRLAVAGHKSYSQKANDQVIVTKAGTTTDNGYAGALIVETVAPEIIDLLHQYGATRQLAGVTGMPEGEYRMPRKTANPTAAFIDEAGTFGTSNGTYDRVQLIANKLGYIDQVSNELLNDSAFSIADQAAQNAVPALALAEDACYFNGTGLGSFSGIVGAIDSASTYDAALSSSWDDYTITKIENWLGKIPVEAWRAGNVKIAASSAFFNSVLMRFGMAAGGNTIADIQRGPSGLNYRGIPVVLAEVLPSTYTADQIVAYAGSFERGTAFGVVNGSERIDASEHYGFATDQFSWRISERVAFSAHDVGGSTSEIIALKD